MCLSQWAVDGEFFNVKLFLIGKGHHRVGTNGGLTEETGALNEKI